MRNSTEAEEPPTPLKDGDGGSWASSERVAIKEKRPRPVEVTKRASLGILTNRGTRVRSRRPRTQLVWRVEQNSPRERVSMTEASASGPAVLGLL